MKNSLLKHDKHFKRYKFWNNVNDWVIVLGWFFLGTIIALGIVLVIVTLTS